MLTLRFQRQGKKRDFIFRIIAVDSKVAINSGKSKEILGWWDPRINKFELKKERILYWISQGAQPSDSCYNLLVRAKIIEGKKRPITIRKKKIKEEKSEAGEKTTQASATEEKTEEKPEEKPTEEKPAEEKKPSSAKATEGKEEKPVGEKKEEPKVEKEKEVKEVKKEAKEDSKKM
jgi:small subunit ribosomal protein S16